MKVLFRIVALLALCSGSSAIQGQEPAQDVPETGIVIFKSSVLTPEETPWSGSNEVMVVPISPMAGFEIQDTNRKFYEDFLPTLAVYLRYYRDCHRVLLANTKETTSFEEYMCQLVYSQAIIQSAQFIRLDPTSYPTDGADSIPSDSPEDLKPVTLIEHYRQMHIAFNTQNNVNYSIDEYLCLYTITNGYDYNRMYDRLRNPESGHYLDPDAGNWPWDQ